MSMDYIELRKKVRGLEKIGDNFTTQGDFIKIRNEVREFGKHKGIPVRIDETEGGAIITRVDHLERAAHGYPQIARLQPGESVLIEVPLALHQRVRVAASQFGRKTDAAFRCSRTGDAILVTRIDGASTEALKALPARSSKYDLDRLATERELVFTLAPPDQQRLRQAATSKKRQTGWEIRCRLQDDGTMRVYRTDNQAKAVEHATIKAA